MQETCARQAQAERARAEEVIAANAAIATNDALEAQNAEKETVAQYSTALDLIENLQTDKNKLQNEVGEAEKALKIETDRANENEKTANTLRHDLSQMKAERDQLAADLESSRNRVRELTDDRTEQYKRYKEVLDDRERAKTAEAKLTDELASVRGRVEALHDQVTEAKSALARTEAQRDSALERLEECKVEWKAGRNKTDRNSEAK
jgi:chromosome segregation ATPase